MGMRTETKFYCDACDEDLPQMKGEVPDVSSEYRLTFRIMIDEALGPRLHLSYGMLCHHCKEDLIKTVQEFRKNVKARRV